MEHYHLPRSKPCTMLGQGSDKQGTSVEMDWTGLTSNVTKRVPKVRAKHVRLTYGWSSADLRLIFISLLLTAINVLATSTYKSPQSNNKSDFYSDKSSKPSFLCLTGVLPGTVLTETLRHGVRMETPLRTIAILRKL